MRYNTIDSCERTRMARPFRLTGHGYQITVKGVNTCRCSVSLILRCQSTCLTVAPARRGRGIGGGGEPGTKARHVNGLGFSRYLSAVALLTSFLRGLLNKAILRVDDLRPRPAQILQRYRFRFHRDAVYRMAALVGTAVCARVRACVSYKRASNTLSMLHRGQGRGYRIGLDEAIPFFPSSVEESKMKGMHGCRKIGTRSRIYILL